MAQIVRCPNCISLIYEGAEACHHCGEKLNLKRRKLLSKGAVLFVVLAVTAFAVGDAIYLAKERGKEQRFDASFMGRFIKQQLLTDQSREQFFASKDGDKNELDRVRAEFRTLVGPEPLTRHRGTNHLDTFEQVVHWHGYPREMRTRRYVYHLEYKQKGEETFHRLPLTVEVAGTRYYQRIVKVDWDNRASAPRASGG